MEEPKTLQLQPSASGQLLFSGEIEQSIEAEEKQGRYTAARLRKMRPAAYEAAVELLGAGVGMLRIGQLLGVHHLTVAAVRDAEPEQVDIARSKMVTDLRHVARLQVERLKEHPELVPFNVAGLLVAQVLDKAELLDGRVTSRSERIDRVDGAEAWRQLMEKQLGADAVREIDAQVVPATGLDGRDISAIEASAASSAAVDRGAAVVPSATDSRASSDAESPDCRSSLERKSQIATDCAAVAGAPGASSGVPSGTGSGAGGGSASDPTPLTSSIHKVEQSFMGNSPSEERGDA